MGAERDLGISVEYYRYPSSSPDDVVLELEIYEFQGKRKIMCCHYDDRKSPEWNSLGGYRFSDVAKGLVEGGLASAIITNGDMRDFGKSNWVKEFLISTEGEIK